MLHSSILSFLCSSLPQFLYSSIPPFPHSPVQWFLFRETYMCRIDKTEDKVNKVFREYQDNWNKYAESLEKDAANVKVSRRFNTYITTMHQLYLRHLHSKHNLNLCHNHSGHHLL